MGDMTVANPTTGIAPAVPLDTRRPSLASTRSLQLGGLVIAVDVLLAAVSVGALYFLLVPTEFAVLLDGVKFVVVGALAALAVRSGIRGLRETAGGQLTRRRWAILGIVIGGFFGLLVASSFVATTIMTLAR